MKSANEDEIPPITDFLWLLSYLWRLKMSVNSVDQATVNVYPAPDDWLAASINGLYDDCSRWLPGICDSCQVWVMSRVAAYWGAHPHLCPDCTEIAVALFDKTGIWPQANIFDGE